MAEPYVQIFAGLADRLKAKRAAQAATLGITVEELAERERVEAQRATSGRIGVLVGDVAQDVRPVQRYASGVRDLDELIGGGITSRQLAVIMAPPGDGKSALAVSIARHVQRTVPVLYASTELESHEIAARVAAPILGCAWREIVDGRIAPARVSAALADLRITVIGCEALPRGDAALAAIEREVQAMTTHERISDDEVRVVAPLVILDYLQDLARGAGDRDVRARIGDLASRLRALSQELDCPILAVSSVSRAYYGSQRQASMRQADDPTVYLAAAKESGDVDYAAAVVVHLDVLPPEPDHDYRIARIAVAKSRHGRTGFVGARFYGATGRWDAGPDEMLAASSRRSATESATAHASDDSSVLAAVHQAANRGEYRTRRSWRELVPGVAEKRCAAAIARLVGAGRFSLQRNHPGTGVQAPGGGEYLVPATAPAAPAHQHWTGDVTPELAALVTAAPVVHGSST